MRHENQSAVRSNAFRRNPSAIGSSIPAEAGTTNDKKDLFRPSGEMADAGDLKSPGLYRPCGFDSRLGYSSLFHGQARWACLWPARAGAVLRRRANGLCLPSCR